MEARCARSDAKVPLEGGKAGSQGGGVRSGLCDLACRTWQERRLGEVARGRSWLELPFQSFLRAIGLFNLGGAGKLVVGCMHG